MASTRSTTGNSRPRVHTTVSTGPERKHRSTGTTGTTKKTTGGARRGRKPGTSGGRTSTGAGVGKRTTTTTTTTTHHQKRKPHLSDKVAGAAEKAVGAATGRPGKKAAGTKRMRGTDGKGGRRA